MTSRLSVLRFLVCSEIKVEPARAAHVTIELNFVGLNCK